MISLRRSSGLCSLLLVFAVAGSAQTSRHVTPLANKPVRGPVSPELEGDVLMARGMFAAALKSYQRETRQSDVLLNKIGVAYHHLLAFDQARKYYQQALALNPRFGQALNNLAAIYYSTGDYAHAERLYTEAIEYQPHHAIMLANLGTAYFADNKYRQGMEAFRKAIALDPNVLHPDARVSVVEGTSTRAQSVAKNYSLAEMFAASGKTPQAISCLRTAFDNGFHNRKKLMKDRNFATLRSTPEFQQLLTEQTADK